MNEIGVFIKRKKNARIDEVVHSLPSVCETLYLTLKKQVDKQTNKQTRKQADKITESQPSLQCDDIEKRQHPREMSPHQALDLPAL